MELINMHTHTEFCGHGKGTVEEIVAAASVARVSTLALTEHYPLSPAFDPEEYLSMPFRRLEEYLDAVQTARLVHPELEILLGCEFDWLGTDEDRSADQIDFSPFELVLGSVHFVDGWAFDDPAKRSRWEEEGPDTIWRRYFEIWCEAVLSDKPFTIMSHPDLPKKFGYYPTYDLMPLYRDAAEALRSAGRMVEVNTSGDFYACKEMYPARALLQEFCKAGVPCTIGADTHHPDNIARGLDAGYKLMYESGYREVTVPTRDGDRRCFPLE